MNEPKDDLVDEMMGLVHRLADQVLSLSPEGREAKFAQVRETGYRAALGAEMGEYQARDAGETLERATRILVRMILAGGAASGGHA